MLRLHADPGCEPDILRVPASPESATEPGAAPAAAPAAAPMPKHGKHAITNKSRALTPKAQGKQENTMMGYKKCGACKKWKEPDGFAQSMSKCRTCFNNYRSLQRMAERQNYRSELDRLATEDSKTHDAVVKAFVREREKCQKDGSKLKFSMKTFYLEYRSRTGVRMEGEGEMMWEGEYMEWSKSAKAGFLSKAEAESNWAKWEAICRAALPTVGPCRPVLPIHSTHRSSDFFPEPLSTGSFIMAPSAGVRFEIGGWGRQRRLLWPLILRIALHRDSNP